MMTESTGAREILKKYWGFTTFRSLQEDIIMSILQDKDTLALLPTGGGKSVCFQVPALLRDGVCLVITPLIALMKDQVANLIQKGIKAVSVYSGMDRNEIDVALDNCRFGGVKFLYVSPERLQSERFIEVLKQMQINLLAVDEAHCISQWGYDFRPPYLQIARIRDLIPDTPVLALTATATPEVVIDIQEKLNFKQPNVFQKSFERENLTYIVYKEEDKLGRLLRIVQRVKGSGIVYVRNRRKTKEIATFLEKNNIRAGYYHAGLDARTRGIRQDEWISGKTTVIAATNAFGMGIDKPDVRFVVHLDVPDSLEAYFQEAGRAGRDGKPSWAVMLYDQADIVQAMSNHASSYPDLKTVRTIYHLAGNYFEVPVGSGTDQQYDFDLGAFCRHYAIRQVVAFNALKILERDGYLMLSEAMNTPSRIYLKVDKEALYHFQVTHPTMDAFIKTLLRSYSGLFSDFVRMDENEIAVRTGMTREQSVRMIQRLQEYDLITYLPQKDKPQLVFSRARVDESHLDLSESRYSQRKQDARKRLDAVLSYLSNSSVCRSQQLLAYFGEIHVNPCNACDVCLTLKKSTTTEKEREQINERIKHLLKQQPLTMPELAKVIGSFDEENLVQAIRWLLDHKIIALDTSQKLQWKKPTR